MPFDMKHYYFTICMTYTLVLLLANIPSLNSEPKSRRLSVILFYFTALLSQMFVYANVLTTSALFVADVITNVKIIIVVNAIILTSGWMFILSNSKVYARYRFNVNTTLLGLVFHKGAGEVIQPTAKEITFFSVTLVVMLILAGGLEYLGWLESQMTAYSAITTHIMLAIFYIYLLNQLSYIVISYYGYMPILQYTCKVYGYHVTSWAGLLTRFNLMKNNTTNQFIKLVRTCTQNKKLNYPKKPIQADPPTKPLNIMMITIDACRFDMFTSTIMPHVTTFSQQAHVFNDHWSNGNTTQPGVFSLFYGLPPNYWLAMKKQHITPVFMDQLQAMNYQMAIYASATLINPPFEQNIFYGVNNLRTFTPGKNPLQRDQQITRDMNQFIVDYDSERPFFGFLFYDSAHGYYTLKDELPQQFTPTAEMNHITVKADTDPVPIFNQYKNSLHAIDSLIATVLATLKTAGLFDSTVVMITSDHGQEFNDLKRNHWEHPSNFAKYQLRTPLVLHWPGQHSEMHQHRTSHCDVVPTLMRRVLAVNNSPADYSIGKDLFDPIDTPFIIAGNYTNYAMVDSEQIVNIQKDGHIQVYDHCLNHIHAPTLNTHKLRQVAQLMHTFYQY